MKEYKKPELQVREIRVTENLAAEWKIVGGQAVSYFRGLNVLSKSTSEAQS